MAMAAAPGALDKLGRPHGRAEGLGRYGVTQEIPNFITTSIITTGVFTTNSGGFIILLLA
jgi:hypothetical protein